MRSILFLSLLFLIPSSFAADYTGRIITDMGSIGIKLYATKKPDTSANFVELAMGKKKYITVEGTKSYKPFYNGQIFHRTHADLGIFSGCPWGTGRGWPGYFINEEEPGDSKFTRGGLIAMAKIKGDNRVGSQFFITTKAQPHLNGDYVIFGEVTSGMDVVQRIANVEHDVTMKPKKPVHIKQIEIQGF